MTPEEKADLLACLDQRDLANLVDRIRWWQAEKIKTDGGRIELWTSIAEGYCRSCGGYDPDHRCECWNDE